MLLTSLQYHVIMTAIENAKSLIAEDDFIDPYSVGVVGLTNETALTALKEVEQKIITDNLPF